MFPAAASSPASITFGIIPTDAAVPPKGIIVPNPAAIRAAVLAGCPDAREIGDRARAIEAALDALEPGDVLAVAGKGHEQGQEIGGTIIPFDDVSVIRSLVGIS